MSLLRVVCWLVASLIIISFASSAVAQETQDYETGLNPYRSYQAGNIDSINLFNRGLNVDIPLISYPQRGGKLHLDFDLHYINQGNWYNCTPGTNCSSFYGTGLTNGFGVILKNWPSVWGTTCQATGDQYGDWTCQGSATMSDGSSHSMLPITVSNWESDDTSGLQMSGFDLQAGNDPPLLIDANGTLYNQTNGISLFPYPVGQVNTLNYIPNLVEDTNGNEISYSQTTGWTDTMGRQIRLPVSANTSVCPQSPLVPVSAYTWNLPGVNGGTGNYPLTFCYVNVAVTQHWDNQIQHISLVELQTVLLPNSTSWTFQYTTDGNGDLSQITFPTGGTLSYTWTTGYPVCGAHYFDNAREVVTRVLNPNDGVSPSGTWTYSLVSNLIPVVTDPASNDTVHTYSSLVTNECPYYETKTQYYQGSHTSGALLKTVSTVYEPLSSNPYLTGLGQPSQTETLWANGQENETAYTTYDSALTFHAPYYISSTEFSPEMGGLEPPATYGLLEVQKDYDYGNGAPGTLLRTTSTTYEALTNSNYLTNNLLSLPASVAVTGSGPGSTTTYAYDQTTPVASGVTTQHSTSPPAGTYRGNLTTASRYLNTTGTYLKTTATNWDTGMVDAVTDPKGNPPTKYGYSSTYDGAYLTSVTNALGQVTTYGYDFNTGLLTSTTDPNNQTTTYAYDNMLWPTQINYPDGGQTSFTYGLSFQGGAYTQITEKMDTAGDNRVSDVWVDGLGREGRVAVTNGETLPYDETVNICYDGLGRISFQGYPFQDEGWISSRSCSIAGDTFAYDALSRGTKVTHSDTSVVSTSYSGSCATVTDEQQKTRQGCADGLGRLNEIIENPGGLNYVTTYTHDALDDLTGVTQVSSRSRTFTYDSLARLTNTTNPESGTVNYAYDSDGNVITRTDARSIATTYAYDAGNRLTEKSYSDGTPSAYYYYDQTTWQNIALTNTVGRLSYQGTWDSQSQWLTISGFSYDPMGRVKNNSQCVLPSCPNGPFSVTYGYDLIGDMTSYTNPDGVLFTQSFNAGGRVKQVTSSLSDSQHPATLVSGLHYNAAASITAGTLGNGLTRTSASNGRLQPCRLNLNSSGTVLSSCTAAVPSGNVLDLTFGLNYGSGDNGNVMSFSAVGAQTFNRSYTYDAANRIYAMSAPGDQCTGLQWTIDAWGNRTNQTATGGTCNAFSQPVSTNNRFSSASYQYDAAGNMLYDGVHHYAYDAENRISTVDSGSTASYTYDAVGRRIAKEATTYYIYDLSGHVTSEYGDCQTCWTVGYIYVNDGLTAMYENSTTFFVHPDHLGSTRLMTAYPAPSIYDCLDYYPFGELIACGSTGGTTHKFTEKERDTESNLDNFQARYMSSTLGRFMSPDPENAGADSTNPQSWNMYSYALNSPLVFTDPTGLDACTEDNDDPTCVPGTGNGYGYSTLPQVFADARIPELLPGLGDDCASNPSLTGCPSGPDLGPPPTGCLSIFCGPIHPDLIPRPRQPELPPKSVQQNMQGCMDAFHSTGLGKAASIGSVFTPLRGAKAAAEWFGLPLLKVATAEAVASFSGAFGNYTAAASLATGETTVVVGAPTVAAVSGLEVASKALGPWAIGAATLIDAAAATTCRAEADPNYTPPTFIMP
jgi:RHS repeat-associated protein